MDRVLQMDLAMIIIIIQTITTKIATTIKIPTGDDTRSAQLRLLPLSLIQTKMINKRLKIT